MSRTKREGIWMDRWDVTKEEAEKKSGWKLGNVLRCPPEEEKNAIPLKERLDCSFICSLWEIEGKKEEKIYVFFDEIQRLKDWSLKIKQLYDSLPNIKIFVSGSASLIIESDVIKNLAGRYFLREIPPLALKEFFELYLQKELDNLELYRHDIEKIFPYYIKRPFPEIVRWRDEKRVYEYIRELVIDKVVKIDIPEIFDKVRINLLSVLIEEFFSNPGEILNMDSLSRSLRIHKTILGRHIDYLRFAKMVKLIKNYRPSIRATSRKLRKVYPYNISLCFPFYPDLEKGEIYESLVASLDIENYWRKGDKRACGGIVYIGRGRKSYSLL